MKKSVIHANKGTEAFLRTTWACLMLVSTWCIRNYMVAASKVFRKLANIKQQSVL